jgi:hypothetical protein
MYRIGVAYIDRCHLHDSGNTAITLIRQRQLLRNPIRMGLRICVSVCNPDIRSIQGGKLLQHLVNTQAPGAPR